MHQQKLQHRQLPPYPWLQPHLHVSGPRRCSRTGGVQTQHPTQHMAHETPVRLWHVLWQQQSKHDNPWPITITIRMRINILGQWVHRTQPQSKRKMIIHKTNLFTRQWKIQLIKEHIYNQTKPSFLKSYSALINIFPNIYFQDREKLSSTYLATSSGSLLLGLSIPICNLLKSFPPTAPIIDKIPLCPLHQCKHTEHYHPPQSEHYPAYAINHHARSIGPSQVSCVFQPVMSLPVLINSCKSKKDK